MGTGGTRHGLLGAALLAVALPAGAAACTRVVDAVALEPTPWPTAGHSANSDPWIVKHHDQIIQMSPRLLVLNFSNLTSDTVRQTAERQAAAIAEGSRYHGYSDSSAPVFLTYQVARVVTLPSASLPVTANGTFDSLALFSPSFSASYGFPDPAAPARSLSLCELFEQGVINEVWIEDGEGPRHAPYNAERKQIYDAQNHPVANSFAPCVGRGGCLEEVDCSVTVRMAHLDSRQPGAGCDLYVRAWSFEGIWDALPAFAPEGNAFVNRDFRTRFGLTFNSWDNICDLQQTRCVDYPTPTSATGTDANGIPWTIPQFIQGCGNASFPPNARARYDYLQTLPVQSRCEHFGLHDGLDGKDALEPYTSARIANADPAFQGCGDGWQIYFRQSVPGRDNRATTASGLPMRNWWPLLFY